MGTGGREVLALRRHVRSVRAFLQPFAVDDGDAAAARGDETCFFQRLQSNRHAGTVRTEHEAEKLVRERELLAVDAVVRHEKPARQSLFDLAAAVGECGCRGLRQERMRETQHRAMQRIAALVGFAQAGRADAQALAGSLDVGCVLGPIASQHDCQTGHAFAADDADLDAGLGSSVGDDGRKPGFDEIDLVDALPAGFKRLPDRKINRFEMRFEQREVLTRKARQNPIGRHGPSFGAAKRELPEADGLFAVGRDVPSADQSLDTQQIVMIDRKATLAELGRAGATTVTLLPLGAIR